MASPPNRPRALRRSILVPLLVAAATTCADQPAELEVAGLAFTRDQLLGLPMDRKLLLGEVAALGRAVTVGEAEELADPLVERRELEYLARVARAARGLDSAGVDDAVLRARYLTDPALELTVRHLLVLSERYETDETRAAARAKAERALDRIRAGEPFPKVAADVSEEPGAEGREGLLSPGREGAWVPEFWNAARALDPGSISGVVETQYGFHVLRLERRDTVPFEEVRHRVALDVADLMGIPTDPYGSPGPEIEIDDSALAGGVWPDPDATGTATDGTGTPDGDVTVARWEGGALTMGDLRRYLATLPAPEWSAALDDPVPVARRAARLRATAAEARAGGATVPGSVAAEVRRDWEQALVRWTYVFGFEEGMSDEALRAAALRALGATGQGPANAREEVHRRGPLLRLRHPVRLRRDEAAETSAASLP